MVDEDKTSTYTEYSKIMNNVTEINSNFIECTCTAEIRLK